MLVHLDAMQELVRSRLHEAARRAVDARLLAEAATPPEPPVQTGSRAAPARTRVGSVGFGTNPPR